LINRLRNALDLVKKSKAHPSLHFDRPLVVFQSDDWGRVGVRDREGWNELQSAGLTLGEKPYDFYSLETTDDLDALQSVLRKHYDSTGRNPSIVMNFITANVDFECSLKSDQVHFLPLSEGLPGKWLRPRLIDAYKEGICEGLFFPALHGFSHFCKRIIEKELAAGGERFQWLRMLWLAQTPYVHWRMPWIGYEYWDPEAPPVKRFLSAEYQRTMIVKAAKVFHDLFARSPNSACAPGYRSNDDTRLAWLENGVRVAQNGPEAEKAPYLDDRGMLHTYRSIEMEPATMPCNVHDLVARAERCFATGVPAVVSIHSLNFHSTIRDFRSTTLKLLDEFLSAMENKFPNLLYVNDEDLFSIVTQGACAGENEKTKVDVTTEKAS
jgi:hypothetical protein